MLLFANVYYYDRKKKKHLSFKNDTSYNNSAYFFEYQSMAWDFCWPVFVYLKILKFKDFETKNACFFLPNDLYAYVKSKNFYKQYLFVCNFFDFE